MATRAFGTAKISEPSNGRNNSTPTNEPRQATPDPGTRTPVDSGDSGDSGHSHVGPAAGSSTGPATGSSAAGSATDPAAAAAADPAAAAASAAERKRAYHRDYQRKRKAERAGKEKRSDGSSAAGNRKAAAQATVDLNNILFSMHLMGASLLKMPSLVLTEDEAKRLAESITRVTELYDVPIMDEKTRAWLNLSIVGFEVYGTRIIAEMAERRKKQPSPPPMVITPMRPPQHPPPPPPPRDPIDQFFTGGAVHGTA